VLNRWSTTAPPAPPSNIGLEGMSGGGIGACKRGDGLSITFVTPMGWNSFAIVYSLSTSDHLVKSNNPTLALTFRSF